MLEVTLFHYLTVGAILFTLGACGHLPPGPKERHHHPDVY